MINAPDSNVPASNDFITTLSNTCALAYHALECTAVNMKHYADNKRKEAPLLSPGQQVWLDARNLKTGCPSKKLDVRCTGPFKILRQVTPLAYQLCLPPSWHIHPVFHVSLLKPASLDNSLHPSISDNSLHPPPNIINEQE